MAEYMEILRPNNEFPKLGYRGGLSSHGGYPRLDISGRHAADPKLGILGMVVLGFFWVSGGMYGNESLMQAGPPGIVFACLVLIPLVYSLPVSLLCAEMSTAIPEDGGSIVWTTRALGSLIGRHNAFYMWVCWAVDSAVYPVLAAGYINSASGSYWAGQGAALGIVFGVTLIKLVGMEAIVSMSTVLSCLTLAPCAVFIVAGLPSLQPAHWIVINDGGLPVQWPLLISWMLWLYSGFFGLGALAGEVKDTKRTFTVSVGILLCVTVLINTLPLMVALSYDPVRSHYVDGWFGHLASIECGAWLGWCFVAGSVVSMIGLYNSQIITAEVTLAYLVQQLLPEFFAAREESGSWLWSVRGGGAAPIFQFVNAFMAFGFVWLPYTLLVEASMLLGAVSSLLFLVSFVVLRWREPELERPFRVPGGTWIAAALCVVPATLVFANLYYELTDTKAVLGVPFLRLYIFLGVVAIGAIVHVIGAIHYGRCVPPPPMLLTDPCESSHSVNFDGDSSKNVILF